MLKHTYKNIKMYCTQQSKIYNALQPIQNYQAWWGRYLAQWLQSLLQVPASCIRVPGFKSNSTSASCFLLVHTLAGSGWQPGAQCPAIHLGYLDGVPDSWLWADPALTSTGIWEVIQRIEDLPLAGCSSGSFFLTSYPIVPFKYNDNLQCF